MLHRELEQPDFVWAIGSLCALHHVPFDADLLLQQFPPPYLLEDLLEAAQKLGLRSAVVDQKHIQPDGAASNPAASSPVHSYYLALRAASLNTAKELPIDGKQSQLLLPPDKSLQANSNKDQPLSEPTHLFLIGKIEHDRVVYFEPGSQQPHIAAWGDFAATINSELIGFVKEDAAEVNDPDQSNSTQSGTADSDRSTKAGTSKRKYFGFAWFIPELLKHKRIWRDVLIASLAIQLMALATPLFTQVVIDKVVVHHTESTLIAVGIGLFVFMVFSAVLTWIRQFLVLHTGNRVDAVLGSSVFAHLLHLPPRYFEHRPTGVIAARLHGVETIREFIASAAITLLLDLPFLLIFLAIMFWYSALLTWIALAIIGLIAGLSFAVAPLFQQRLNQQFLLGARNQAFLTEYVAGMETVKSLQMEPQLIRTWRGYLATYLQAGFAMKQIGNSYNVAANTLEQMMTLAILVIGAYVVMNNPGFSIGMLVAFQMFAGRVSQPMLRLVGLWQQFQQASIAVKRLGDILDAPTEPYAVVPARMAKKEGGGSHIVIEGLAFRYGEHLPFLYEDLNMHVPAGQTMAVMGPSGCGKSTLTKLLQAFYLPEQGRIQIDGIDIRYLSANELRSYFGIVPQETTLFSGTIYQNLAYANPNASFEDIVLAARLAEIHEAIEQLPNGYQTEIGERGVGLSGGQKQRIAIARALLKKPKILIFDEATASLDQHTAEQIANTINRLKGSVTILFISHALPRTLQMDGVVKFQSGKAPMMITPEQIKR